ncbi:hypothetical protein [Pseudomonas sp. D(2018)]|uniref:hypothetical protein n=1 Tax=Pseudomonas sp. D(2018) TaxID=2502238 RepID=UPI0010FA43EE|nr:hypothetical protein [Pseudomonas sp. D(2018)]
MKLGVLVLGVLVGCCLLFLALRRLKRTVQVMLAVMFLIIGTASAWMLGVTTELVLPGGRGIAAGAGAGGLAGYVASLFLGTLGVATGGVAFAVGAVAMTVIFSVVGALGATAAGFGLRTVHSWVIAVPIVLLALALLIRRPVPAASPDKAPSAGVEE